MDDDMLGALSQKYPNLNLQLAMPDEDFFDCHSTVCMEDVPINPHYLAGHEDTKKLKASLISNVDLSHLEIGTKVTIGDLTMKVLIHPDTLSPSGSISFNYKI
jgi:hypothetical protein